ncbi:MAG: electron transport complex subunit RsxG [Halioglobus sp.]
MLGRSISRNSLLLALFAVVTTLLIAGTYLQTRDRIALSQRQAEERALLEIIPASRHNNSMLDDTLPIGAGTLGLREDKQIYLARQSGETIAVIIPATASDGYSGDIDMIIGVNRDGSVAGVRVLSHKETPGLGDKVDLKKSDWILDFNGRSLTNPGQAEWAVKKDKGVFDQFTGATITPRAVVGTTLNVLQYAKAQHETLFANEAANGSTGEQ